jgi:hypothetical protein
MRRTLHAIFLITSLIGVGSWAQDELPSPTVTHRQLADCMMRRMSANRTLSYNDAAKTCKDLLKARKADTAANVVSKPVG